MTHTHRRESLLAAVALAALALAACDGAGTDAVDQSTNTDSAMFTASDGGTPADDLALAPNGVTTLRVHYPAGTQGMTVRGAALPLDWNAGISLTVGADDTWQYVLTLPDTVAQVEWKPLLDDSTWSRGPNYIARRGETLDVYPHFHATAGSVSQLFTAFHSTLLGNNRVVWLYLPASYGENTRATYPVLYMHDGQNLFTTLAPWGGWHVGEALDAASEDGSIRDVIVVAPENAGSKRLWEYTPSFDSSEGDGGGGDLYVRMLVEELKPQVDAMLRTKFERTSTGVLGSSLGGLISAYAGVKKANVFGIVGAMSPATWWDNDMILAQVQGMTSPRPERVYVDYGDGADGGEETVKLVSAYLALGYAEGTSFHSYIQPGGEHQENFWASRFPGAMKFLFGRGPGR